MFENIKIGADPEMFAFDRTSGAIISAHEWFPGTKTTPFIVHKGALQLDGVAMEFNIDPASTREEFVQNIITVMSQARAYMPENTDQFYSSIAEFPEEYFKSLPFQVRQLGCSPDFNAWKGGMQNPSPFIKGPIRAAGGHIHIGFTEDQNPMGLQHVELCCDIIKQLDYYVGLWDSIHTLYDDQRRKELYGQAGAMRPKSYGVEYRTPSNYWLQDEFYMEEIFDLSMLAIKDFSEGKKAVDTFGDSVQSIINNNKDREVEELYYAVHKFIGR